MFQDLVLKLQRSPGKLSSVATSRCRLALRAAPSSTVCISLWQTRPAGSVYLSTLGAIHCK